MGVAPTGTGWFGRGKAGATSKYELANAEYLKRPAAKQSDGPPVSNAAYVEGSNEYNIWYGECDVTDCVADDGVALLHERFARRVLLRRGGG